MTFQQAPPPNPQPRPASGSHRFPNTLGQVGEQYGPSIGPFARARCPFLPLLRPYSSGGAARGSHAGQFPCFGPRSCFICIAPVLDIPNGVWPLNRAVGRAYIRKTEAVLTPTPIPDLPCGMWDLKEEPGLKGGNVFLGRAWDLENTRRGPSTFFSAAPLMGSVLKVSIARITSYNNFYTCQCL
jgi:hypothetical protein